MEQNVDKQETTQEEWGDPWIGSAAARGEVQKLRVQKYAYSIPLSRCLMILRLKMTSFRGSSINGFSKTFKITIHTTLATYGTGNKYEISLTTG